MSRLLHFFSYEKARNDVFINYFCSIPHHTATEVVLVCGLNKFKSISLIKRFLLSQAFIWLKNQASQKEPEILTPNK